MMTGLSAALHGLALIGVPVGDTRAPDPVAEDQFVSTVRMIKPASRPRQTAPPKPLEKKVVEKIVEPRTEVIPEEEPDNYEEAREASQQSDTADNEEVWDGSEYGVNDAEAREDEADADREYAALLAYIREFINRNLVYPAMARRRNIEGVVGVSFEIDGNGAVSAIAVYDSSGSPLLDNAAVSLVKKIRPLTNKTVKRKLVLRVSIDYELTE